jgi:hypothetical protein
MASNIFPGVYYIQTPGGLYVTHPEPGHVDLVTTTPDQSAAQQVS